MHERVNGNYCRSFYHDVSTVIEKGAQMFYDNNIYIHISISSVIILRRV
ncbi:hypothetical protein PUN28_007709 [Cardiocondyla obscurior]|uniref:Uncharacterized protein n=1 Tax=Cardiocondyla obscurior TaxID=286306 RepID=A0AAW2FW88_9HYME